jgi:glyoxylase-like metal-dependent hydrolase (beta-lactamase superfamily II)
MRLGNLQLSLLSDGIFHLDGGAMFGVVPRVLWEKQKPADDKNRNRMQTHSLLVEKGNDLLLVDTGIGDKNDQRFRRMFGMEEGAERLPDALRRVGYAPEDVTHVLQTHLHFDHCGWNTRLQGGRLVPTFPRARYWLARDEVEHARAPNPRDRASYDERNWQPLFAAGLVELYDGEAEPISGVRAVPAPGHNAGMRIVLLDGGANEPIEIEAKAEESSVSSGGFQKAAFWADLVPTVSHLPYPWVMGFDLYPLQTMENKERWLPQAAREGWLCFFQHEAYAPMGRLREVKPGRYRSEPLPVDAVSA